MNAAVGRLRPRGRVDLGDYPVDAAWSNDGKTLIVAGGEGAILRLSSSGTDPAQVIGRHPSGVLAVSWQKAGRLFVTSGQDGAVLLWDARSLTPQKIQQAAQWSQRLAFSDSGRWLAVASGKTLHLYDDSGKLQHRLDDHPGSIAAIGWRPKSHEVAAAGNNGLRVHRLEPELQLRDFRARGACLTAAWHPEGRVLAAGMQDGTINLWNVATGTQSDIQGLGSRVFATEWSSNGRYLAAAASSALVGWDSQSKSSQSSQPFELRAHSDRLTALSFRPSGTWLVSAARDRRLLLWRVGAAEHPQDAHLLPDEGTVLRFSRDGALLAVGDALGGLTIYECS
ncbi:MAG TPA: WD40 repeat domain-containing protein [Steroidobacteraceae bacterium]|jgi:WD40 repeat protein|nr:WD40 repeat domain-containing protein [Steroidobacteraceae bacterium]